MDGTGREQLDHKPVTSHATRRQPVNQLGSGGEQDGTGSDTERVDSPTNTEPNSTLVSSLAAAMPAARSADNACESSLRNKGQSAVFDRGSSYRAPPGPVAPDESFVVFGSSRPPAREIDLFIAFRDGKTWGTPQHLGDVVNSAGSDAEARLSSDARTLYFSSDRRSTASVDREAAWNNGKYNVWRVNLDSCSSAQHPR